MWLTSPLTATYERLEEPCEWYAATQKHGKYDADFKGTQYVFCAMIFETLGAVNVEGEEVLRQLFRFAAKLLVANLLLIVVGQSPAIGCAVYSESY